MSETLIGILITSLVSLISIFVSAKTTRDKVTQKLDANQQVTNNDIEHIKADMSEMKADIRTHNNYARLFSENIPVLKEQIASADHRIETLEQFHKPK